MMVIINLKIGLSKNVQQNRVTNKLPSGNLLAIFDRYVSTKAPSLELSGFYKQK